MNVPMTTERFFEYAGRRLSLTDSAINLDRDAVLRWRNENQRNGFAAAAADALSVEPTKVGTQNKHWQGS